MSRLRYTTTTAWCGHRQSTYGLIKRSGVATEEFAEQVVEKSLCSRCYAKVQGTPKGCVTPLGRERIVKRMKRLAV